MNVRSKVENEDSFDIKAAKVISKYTGDDMGITHIKYLIGILNFCKRMNKEFKFPMPDKEISVKWNVTDWCDYLDLTWQERGKKDDIE